MSSACRAMGGLGGECGGAGGLGGVGGRYGYRTVRVAPVIPYLVVRELPNAAMGSAVIFPSARSRAASDEASLATGHPGPRTLTAH